MTEEEIIKEFVSIEQVDVEVVLSVCVIDWRGRSYNPVSYFVEVDRFQGDVSSEETRKVVKTLLRRKKYFRRCVECAELNPQGWMHNSRICQSCAEQNHGIVH